MEQLCVCVCMPRQAFRCNIRDWKDHLQLAHAVDYEVTGSADNLGKKGSQCWNETGLHELCSTR